MASDLLARDFTEQALTLAKLNGPLASAQRVLAAAARGLSPMDCVLASPPMWTEGSAYGPTVIPSGPRRVSRARTGSTSTIRATSRSSAARSGSIRCKTTTANIGSRRRTTRRCRARPCAKQGRVGAFVSARSPACSTC